MEEYFEDKGVLYNADCVPNLAGLEVDMVIADPPYNIGFDAGKGWDSFETEGDYLAWSQEWTEQAWKALKDGGVFIVWGTLKTDTFLKYKLDVLNNLSDYESMNEIVWSYNWGGRSSKNFARKHEVAWVGSKGGGFLFNGDDVRVERKVKKNPRTGEPYSKGTIPTCVWEFNNHTMSKDFVNWHPTTKNIDVLERMIRAYTDVGDVVLDPFMGSGSTAVAAVRSGRRFVGFEVDDEYFEKSVERIVREV